MSLGQLPGEIISENKQEENLANFFGSERSSSNIRNIFELLPSKLRDDKELLIKVAIEGGNVRILSETLDIFVSDFEG